MIDAALHWSMTHWRIAQKVMASLYLGSIGEKPPRFSFYWNQQLLALDMVLEKLNISNRLSPATVRNMSGAEPILE